MNTFAINQHGVIVKHEDGTSTIIRKDSPYYMDAKNAVMTANWEEFGTLAIMDEDLQTEVAIDIASSDDTPNEKVLGMLGLIGMITGMTINDMVEDDSPEFEAEDYFVSIEKTLSDVKGLLSDGLISAEEIITDDNLDLFASAMPQSSPSHEHDLSNWSGSPIFYPTREMARAQADRWGMFWEYHDFGIASPAGYRYATVPRGIGPTAPEGYDWVCLPREE